MTKALLEVRLFPWFDQHWYKIKYLNEMGVEVEDYFASVTTKLGALDKPFLRRWYGTVGLQEALRIMREAGDRGSRIHWGWQVYGLGGALIYDPEHHSPYTPEEVLELKKKYDGNYFVMKDQDEQFQLDKLMRWDETVQPKQNKTEQIVYDIDTRDAGTLDNLMLIDEGKYMIAGATPITLDAGWYVVDLKTGSTVDDSAKMQVSRYSMMVEKMFAKEKHPIQIIGGLIIHTSAKTKRGIEGLTTIHMNRDEILERNRDYLDIAKVWERNCKDQKPKIRELPALIIQKERATQ